MREERSQPELYTQQKHPLRNINTLSDKEKLREFIASSKTTAEENSSVGRETILKGNLEHPEGKKEQSKR